MRLADLSRARRRLEGGLAVVGCEGARTAVAQSTARGCGGVEELGGGAPVGSSAAGSSVVRVSPWSTRSADAGGSCARTCGAPRPAPAAAPCRRASCRCMRPPARPKRTSRVGAGGALYGGGVVGPRLRGASAAAPLLTLRRRLRRAHRVGATVGRSTLGLGGSGEACGDAKRTRRPLDRLRTARARRPPFVTLTPDCAAHEVALAEGGAICASRGRSSPACASAPCPLPRGGVRPLWYPSRASSSSLPSS